MFSLNIQRTRAQAKVNGHLSTVTTPRGATVTLQSPRNSQLPPTTPLHITSREQLQALMVQKGEHSNSNSLLNIDNFHVNHAYSVSNAAFLLEGAGSV
jgi:hypothetical protein